MGLEKRSKEVKDALIKAGNFSKKTTQFMAQDALKGWLREYFLFEDGKLNNMQQGKLYMDYGDNIRPNLVDSGSPIGSIEYFDYLASKLVEKDKRYYGSCPNC